MYGLLCKQINKELLLNNSFFCWEGEASLKPLRPYCSFNNSLLSKRIYIKRKSYSPKYWISPDFSRDKTSKKITYNSVPDANPCKTTDGTAYASDPPVSLNKIPIPIPMGDTIANTTTYNIPNHKSIINDIFKRLCRLLIYEHHQVMFNSLFDIE